MKLNQLQSNYTQKSRIFFYPLLGIRRGVSTVPVSTFMAWEDYYEVADKKFFVQYQLREDAEFKTFEEKCLLGNPLFHDFFELTDDTGVYVFDMEPYKSDHRKIVHGKYSKLAQETKRLILGFFRNHQAHHAYIESYVNPQKYFENYAKLLGVPKRLLEEVGELCDLPNYSEETLRLKKKVLNFESVHNL